MMLSQSFWFSATENKYLFMNFARMSWIQGLYFLQMYFYLAIFAEFFNHIHGATNNLYIKVVVHTKLYIADLLFLLYKFYMHLLCNYTNRLKKLT